MNIDQRKQDTLDVLDRLLGCQDGTQQDKITALREVAAAAKRMADGIEQRLNG